MTPFRGSLTLARGERSYLTVISVSISASWQPQFTVSLLHSASAFSRFLVSATVWPSSTTKAQILELVGFSSAIVVVVNGKWFHVNYVRLVVVYARDVLGMDLLQRPCQIHGVLLAPENLCLIELLLTCQVDINTVVAPKSPGSLHQFPRKHQCQCSHLISFPPVSVMIPAILYLDIDYEIQNESFVRGAFPRNAACTLGKVIHASCQGNPIRIECTVHHNFY